MLLFTGVHTMARGSPKAKKARAKGKASPACPSPSATPLAPTAPEVLVGQSGSPLAGTAQPCPEPSVGQVSTNLSSLLPPHIHVQHNAANWQILGDAYLCQIANQGLLLDWIEGFDPENPLPEFRPQWWESRADRLPPTVATIVHDWLVQGVIKEVPPHVPLACSSIFVVPKRDSDEFRLITNLKNLNPFLKTTYFHLPTLHSILPYFKKGMWATSIDIKSAYLHWPISARDKPYLCFEYAGRYYQHQALPFGLSVAPREWQRAMQAVVNYMRNHGCLIWVYLDDFLLLGYSAQEVLTHTKHLLHLLGELGIQVNFEKSELNPVQTLRYLGFLLNLLEGKVEIPTKKLTSIIKDVASLLKVHNPSARKLASVLGRLRSLLFALPQIKLWTDQLAAHIHTLNQWGWEATSPLPQPIVAQLNQTIDLLQSWKGKPFVPDLPTHTLYSDASDLGWGAVSEAFPDPIAGWFLHPQLQDHINLKEARALLEAIQVYNLRDVHLQVYTDSTTVFWYLKKWGGEA